MTATAKHAAHTMQATATLAAGFLRAAYDTFANDLDNNTLLVNPTDALYTASEHLGQRGPHAQAAILMAAGAVSMHGQSISDAIAELEAIANH